MSKSKKKRSKKYTGADAANARPSITKISVPDRSKLGRWYHENRKRWAFRLRLVAIPLIILGVIYLLLSLIF